MTMVPRILGRWFMVRLGIAALGSVLIAAPVDAAAVFIVNSTADTDDGTCGPPGNCTLREAIAAANATPGRDTIRFDPAVFPPGLPATIAPATALPTLTDPAGTVVTGDGAGVVLDGGALAGSEDGLSFHTSAGVALTDVTVRVITIQNFPRHGLVICGGAADVCDDPLTDPVVAHVRAHHNGFGLAGFGNGISIDGGTTTGARVRNSVATGNNGRGINVNARANNVGTTVEHTRVSRNSTGININAGDDTINATVSWSTATRNLGSGVNINAGNNNTGATVTNTVAIGNEGSGININAGGPPDTSTAAFLARNVAADNTGNGIDIDDATDSVIEHNIADSNGLDGLLLRTPGSGNTVRRNWAHKNVGAGIRVEDGNTDNLIRRNRALGNTGTDLVDDNAGCDSNTWVDNAFVTRSDPCIN